MENGHYRPRAKCSCRRARSSSHLLKNTRPHPRRVDKHKHSRQRRAAHGGILQRRAQKPPATVILARHASKLPPLRGRARAGFSRHPAAPGSETKPGPSARSSGEEAARIAFHASRAIRIFPAPRRPVRAGARPPRGRSKGAGATKEPECRRISREGAEGNGDRGRPRRRRESRIWHLAQPGALASARSQRGRGQGPGK